MQLRTTDLPRTVERGAATTGCARPLPSRSVGLPSGAGAGPAGSRCAAGGTRNRLPHPGGGIDVSARPKKAPRRRAR